MVQIVFQVRNRITKRQRTCTSFSVYYYLCVLGFASSFKFYIFYFQFQYLVRPAGQNRRKTRSSSWVHISDAWYVEISLRFCRGTFSITAGVGLYVFYARVVKPFEESPRYNLN